MKNIIKFISNHPENKNLEQYKPAPVKEYMPDWYLQKDKYKKLNNGLYQTKVWDNPNTDEKLLKRTTSWKSCPAILDVFMTGYYLLTPCDVSISIKGQSEDGSTIFKVDLDDKFKLSVVKSGDGRKNNIRPFCRVRGVEEGYPIPDGYDSVQLVWRNNWYTQVPEGYTTLFAHPLNINDLPFRTINGFIDCSNDIVGSGNIPFHIKKGWEGTIKAGTPYVQVIPYKNEHWSHDLVYRDEQEIFDFIERKKLTDFVGPDETKYKQHSWLKKRYE